MTNIRQGSEHGKTHQLISPSDNGDEFFINIGTRENAKPVPARRQKRLFDDTREAEKVIQYLAQLKPGDVAQVSIFMLVSGYLFSLRQQLRQMDQLTVAFSICLSC